MKRPGVIASLTAAVIFLLGILSCDNLKLDSKWRTRDLVIDGNYDDWEGALSYSEDKGATLGFINDDRNLYMCLMSADRGVVMRALSAGFLVEIDGSGKKDEELGIRFPVGGKVFSPDKPGREHEPGMRDKGAMQESLEKQSDLFLISGGKPRLFQVSDLNKLGMAIKLGQYMGRFVYEMQIPLEKSESHPYAVNAVPGRPVKIKFELGEMKRRPI